MTAHNLLESEQSRQQTAKQRILHQLFHVSRPVTVLSVALLAATAVLGSTINTISYLNSISASLPIAAGHRTIQHPSSHTQNLALLGSSASGQVLGDSITAPHSITDVNSTIAGFVNSQLKQYLAQGQLTGPQGPQGPAGATVVQNSNGQTTMVIQNNPIVTYVPSQQSDGFNGGSILGVTNLSSANLTTQTANIQGALTVSGSATVAGSENVSGNFTAGTSTISSLTVSGPVNLTGSTTIAGLNVTGFNPGLTQGSIAFQGATALSQDNANLFYNSATHSLGLGTSSPSSTLFIQGTGAINPLVAASSTGSSMFVLTAGGTVSIGSTSPTTIDPTYGITTPNVVAPIQPENLYALNSTYSAIANMYSGTGNSPSQLRIMMFGDSTAGFHSGYVLCTASAKYGANGFDFGGGNGQGGYLNSGSCPVISETTNSTTGTVTVNNGTSIPYDFTKSPTGAINTISSGGSITFGANGSYGYGNTLKVYYLAEPGAGTITITSYSPTLGTTTEFSASAANPTTIGKVFKVVKSSPAQYTLTVSASGGPVDVFAAAIYDTTTNGIIDVGTGGRGGLSLPDSVSTPSAVVSPWLASAAGSGDTTDSNTLAMFEMKDNGITSSDGLCEQATTAAPTTFQPYSYWISQYTSQLLTADPLVDIEFTGSYSGYSIHPCLVAFNNAERAWAAANQGFYYDDYYPASSAQMAARGWLTYNNIHETASAQIASSLGLWQAMGWDSWFAGAEQKPVADYSVTTQSIWLGDASPNAPAAGVLNPVNYQQSSFYPWMHTYGIVNSGGAMATDISGQYAFWNWNHTAPIFCMLTAGGSAPSGCVATVQQGGFSVAANTTFQQSTSSTAVLIQGGSAGQATLNINDGTGSGNTLQFLTNSGSSYLSASVGFNFRATASGYTFSTTASNTNRLVITNAGAVGIGTSAPASTLFVQGSGATSPFVVASSTGTQLLTVNTTGALTASDYPNCSGFTTNSSGLIQCTASDERLKQDINPLGNESGLAAINALDPVSFYWQDPSRGTSEQFGFIAQQVQQIFPNLVSTTTPTALTPGGTLTLNYDGLISPLILATQELSASSTAMQNAISNLQNQVSNLQNSLGGNASSSNLTVYSPSNFSGDSVGEAEIPAGQTSVRVSFSQPYEYQPIVTAFPEGAFTPGFIAEKDDAGFTLAIPQATTSAVTFDWHSFASPNEQLTVTGGAPQAITLVVAPSTPTTNQQLTESADSASSSTETPTESDSSATGTPDVVGTAAPASDQGSGDSTTTASTASSSTPPLVTPTPTGVSTPTPTVSPTPTPPPDPSPSPTLSPADTGATIGEESDSGF